jgi:succinate-semialdehyde dehydrogenase/glutarate-semialdehyde dehydrogenase
MSEQSIVVRSPHDGSVIGEVVCDDWTSIDSKVNAASQAMAEWSQTSPTVRAEALIAIAVATRSQLPELVSELVREHGKTHREATMELDRYTGQFIQYAGLATTAGGRHHSLGAGVTGWVERRPVGVVAAVVPWNFPASLFGSKVAPALAAGCGFIVKPAESTSLITIRLAEIAKQYLPAGLVDVVVGGGAIATSLVEHPIIRRVAFTGSTDVGRMVSVAGAQRFKRMTLELGGCDPFVLLADADLATAVKSLSGSRFYNAGQVCVAPKRLVVERSVLDETVDLLRERLGRVVLGNSATNSSTTMGPMHRFEARTRLLGQIEDAMSHGAHLIGGAIPESADLAAGPYLEPGLLIDPPSGARVRTEETFGPVLTVIPFDSHDDAVRIANETPFGLGSSVWGGDVDRCISIAEGIDAGYKWINALGRVYDELPFGGVKESGLGREHGTEALESYFEDTTVIVGTGRSVSGR